MTVIDRMKEMKVAPFKEFLEAGKRRLSGDTARQATSPGRTLACVRLVEGQSDFPSHR